ncbi:MAG TPA: MATE family efflux transporter [Acetobacteraceae bacterium]
MCSTDLSWAREARALGRISIAVSITMFAQLAISAVETLIVARLGARALAGVTLALAVYLLLFLFALGIVTAITPIVAGAYGRGDMQELRVSGQQGLWVGLMVSLPAALLLFVCRGIVVRMVGAGAEADSAAAFLAGAAWGLPAWVSYVAVRCLAVATGQARVTTLLMLASVPVHAALTWWLVFGGFGVPACGVAGAGAAYAVTAYGALALLAVILCLSPGTAFASVFRYPIVLDPARCAAILRLGLPFACRIVLREGVLPAVAFAVAPFGASAVAAHAVAARIVELTGVFSFGFSDAANMRVSYAIGRARPDAARHTALVAIQLSAVVGIGVAGILVMVPATLLHRMLGNVDAATIATAAALLPIAAALQFLEAVQSAAGGALSGLRDAKGPLFISALGAWLVGIPVGVLLAHWAHMSVAGMWLGLVVGASLTTALYLARLRSMLARQRITSPPAINAAVALAPATSPPA